MDTTIPSGQMEVQMLLIQMVLVASTNFNGQEMAILLVERAGILEVLSWFKSSLDLLS